ncbi:hypothetical protein ALC57_11760 [Trachymyrmex cornetzi]|uniref:Helix-turn-helix domain-containing protein n=1 Tax=Trachymyrmex cornetzi TaxID=471704 RepID=A0A151J1X5_9HYME|nr:hypothetical protein ALC57_11760 [Trachymyrmex cornetzi]
MEDIEKKIHSTINIEIPIYFRYVDDILIALPYNEIENTLKLFNKQHNRIKFTVEGNESGVNFLDVTIKTINNTIIFDLYRKPTFSGRYLNFHSNHPMIHKKGIVISLLDRIIFLSHPNFHTKNITNMINDLINNGYPLEFLFNTINNRIKSLTYKVEHKNNKNNDLSDSQIKKFVTLPYVSNITEKLKHLYKKYNINVAYKPTNSLSQFIKTVKDKLNKNENNHLVYKMKCLNCENSYVGRTKRKLKTRIKEHRADIYIYILGN